METEKIYIGCRHSGPYICRKEGEYSDHDHETNDGCGLYAEGTHDDIIAEAIKSLATRRDLRAGGADDHYRWKTDMAVLKYLGGPEIEFDKENMCYKVLVEAE